MQVDQLDTTTVCAALQHINVDDTAYFDLSLLPHGCAEIDQDKCRSVHYQTWLEGGGVRILGA